MAAKDETDPPYFGICEECGKHGHFVFPAQGNASSEEILTQKDGVEWLICAKEEGIVVATYELMELEKQIRASGLPLHNSNLAVKKCNTYGSVYFDDIVVKMLERFPLACRHQENGTTQ